jgi:hypothetical protein
VGILGLAPPPAHASHCVAYHDVSLELLIDYSGSMAGLKHETARAFALQVIDDLNRTGRLRQAGGIGFPIVSRPRNGFLLPISEDVAALRARVLGAPDPTGGWTPLYHAIVVGSGQLQDLPVPGKKILVVISDGLHTDPPGGPVMPRSEAVTALGALAGWKYLVFLEEYPTGSIATCADLTDPGALDLCEIGTMTSSTFRVAGPGTATELAERVLVEACRNHAPTVSVPSPLPLRLGEGGHFTATFDARASSDRETSFANLDFAWRLTPLSGSPRTWSERGSAGAIYTETFTDADIGGWEIHLEVTDAEGARHEITAPFEVIGIAPQLDLQGGGTIDVLEPIAVRTAIVDDVDGGPLSFDWEIMDGPPDGTYAMGTHWTTAEIPPWTTDETDITVLSDRTTRRSAADGMSVTPIRPWRFRLTANDNEMQTTTGEITVDVANRVPTPSVEGPTQVEVGGPIELAAAATEDPDGGSVSLVWDVVQAPVSDPGGGARLDASHATPWTIPTGERHAGTWIFRLGVTDNEGELVDAERTVLVDAEPEITIVGGTEVLSLTGPLDLDGSGSIDPDSDTEHTNLDGAVRDVSPGIVRWSWSLVDVPLEHMTAFPTGGVADVLGVPGRGPTLHLDPGTLRPGEWTLQLEVEDGEGNVASEQVRVTVIDEQSRPVAIVSAPRRYTLDLLSRPDEGVVVSGTGSFDPDDAPTGRPGIDAYRWEIVSAPACAAATAPPATPTWEIFPAGPPIPASCHGAWLVRLTVVDNDLPTPREDSATTEVVVSTCADPVCIDYPTGSPPAIADQSGPIDVPIFYHLDSALYSDPRFRFGLIARLQIFHRDDPSTPEYTAWDAEVSAAPAGPGLQFRWTGRRGLLGPRRGVYDVAVSLINSSMGAIFTARKERAIVISGADPVFDCGSFWAGGFPDGRDGGAFPCVELLEPFALPPVPVRVHYPPGWEIADPRNAERLLWTSQAARRAWLTLSLLGGMPDLEVVLSDRPSPDPADEDDLAVEYGWEPGEPCPIIVYPLGIDLDRGPFQQTVAHEVAHCFQHHNWDVSDAEDEWWIEGTAEFLSNLVYPEVDFEHEWLDDVSPRAQIYNQSYPTVAFFQSLANHPRFGVEGVIRLMGALATPAARADPAAVLAAQPGMADAFHAYAEQLFGTTPDDLYGGIADTGGGHWPRFEHGSDDEAFDLTGSGIANRPGNVTLRLDGGTLIMPAGRFTTRLYRFSIQPGFIYHVRLETRGGVRSSAAQGWAPPIWGALPAELRPPCDGDVGFILVSNATATAGDHELRMTVTSERNPACP